MVKARKAWDAQIERRSRIRYLMGFMKKRSRQIGVELGVMRRVFPLRAYAVLHTGAVLIPFGASYYEDVFYATRGLPCKLLYAERNAPELEMPKDPFKRELFLRILKQADGAVLQTEDERQFYVPVLTKNVAVIHNPIKPSLPRPYEGERRHTVINFCRVADQKNLPLLIEAFIKLHEEYPDYRLEIYGNTVEPHEEQLCQQLKELVTQRGCQDCIAILPPAADVHVRVLDAAMFVSSSDFEGLSNSMIEAMAIGLPCVCTDCLGGGAREIIRDGENGLLVPIQDVDALCQGMKRFVDDPEFATSCGQRAADIRNKLTADRIGAQWLEVIERL